MTDKLKEEINILQYRAAAVKIDSQIMNRFSVYIQVCSGQLKLATVLEFFRYWFSDSFGDNPPLYSCGLTSL